MASADALPALKPTALPDLCDFLKQYMQPIEKSEIPSSQPNCVICRLPLGISEPADINKRNMVYLNRLPFVHPFRIKPLDNNAVRLPCQHIFGKDCIIKWLDCSRHCPLCRVELYDKDTYVPLISQFPQLEYGDAIIWTDPPDVGFEYVRVKPAIMTRILQFNQISFRQKRLTHPHEPGCNYDGEAVLAFLISMKTDRIAARWTRNMTAKAKYITPENTEAVREHVLRHSRCSHDLEDEWIAEKGSPRPDDAEGTAKVKFLVDFMFHILDVALNEYMLWRSIVPHQVFDIMEDTLLEKSDIIAELMWAAKRGEREWPWIKVVGANGEDEKLAPWPNPITD